MVSLHSKNGNDTRDFQGCSNMDPIAILVAAIHRPNPQASFHPCQAMEELGSVDTSVPIVQEIEELLPTRPVRPDRRRRCRVDAPFHRSGVVFGCFGGKNSEGWSTG